MVGSPTIHANTNLNPSLIYEAGVLTSSLAS